MSCRISTLDPGYEWMGQASATMTASSKVSAAMTEYPPMISLASTCGPSVTLPLFSSFPPPCSASPRSTTFFLNLSFQAVQAANMACSSSGEDCGVGPGGFQYKNRYLFMTTPQCFAPLPG